MGPSDGGMRERKKLATRRALSAAALRLAREHGPQNVRVDDIAEAAGVPPRTYNNYFSSREQAIVVALAAERGKASQPRCASAPPTSRSNTPSSARSSSSTPRPANPTARRSR